MRKLLILALLVLPAKVYAIRAVMEQTMASANTIFIDTQAVAVGIATAPASGTKLDVNGLSQFGTTGKSTFTATGALNMASGTTITLAGSGGKLVSASSITASGFFGTGATLTSVVSGIETVTGGLTASSGTFTATGSSQYSLQTSSGIKMQNNGCLQFGDGTNQCSSAGSIPSGGFAALSGTQTLSGINTFSGGVVFSSSTQMDRRSFSTINLQTDNATFDDSGQAVWAQSKDGAVQSSGCIVSLSYPDGGALTDQLIFTSTTTALNANAGYMMAVLLETCSPLQKCRVGIRGFYRVQADSSGIGDTSFVGFSTANRCTGGSVASFDSSIQGRAMQNGAVSANAYFYMRLLY